ncbi:MAG: IS200/IS605 family transposase [Candidatus Saganbacteria bacterium]|nr:IS200/IS605 family transposase [Candidatus Saganbacteria bacterium]
MSKFVHYVFNTYKRRPILVPEIAADLEQLFESICEGRGFKLIRQNILIEHVHLLVEKKETESNEYVMQMIKGVSARRIFEKYDTNRFVFRKLWGRGYRAETIEGEAHLQIVKQYISSQKIDGIDKRIVSIGNRDI